MKGKQNTTDTDPLVDARTAGAEFGGKSVVTIWRWEKQGILPPARRINGRKFWRRSEIEQVKTGETAA